VEAVQRFTDDPLTVCEACGGRLRKVFFPAGIVFKGSGFYRTDSRNGAKSTSTAVKDKPADESTASSSSSDSKPADKPAAKSGTSGGSSPSKSSAGEKAA
jgi:predicted nucleic acid-binding Zn ribbon protein